MPPEPGRAAPSTDPPLALLATLREVVEALAGLERRAGSRDERRAAEWLADRLTRAGVPAAVEEVEFLDGYAAVLMPLAVLALAAAALARGGRRRVLPALLAGLAAAGLVDDVSNYRRVWRRAVARRKRTWNVVAEAGDRKAARTVVVMAHHDAAPTGLAFDQSLQRWLAASLPGLVARVDTSLPLWWPIAAGPGLVAVGGLTGRRRPRRVGAALCALSVGLAIDIARSPVVPGANDNLSGVAALVALAERLEARPPDGVRVQLVSCGAEEVIQGGIYGFAQEHFAGLDRETTWFLNLDTIGSPELILVEGEGPFWMEDYVDPSFRDLISESARRVGGPLRRGPRSRASTDAVIPLRAGYRTATLASWEPDTKLLSNYHLMSDTPENVNLVTVARAVEVVAEVVRSLSLGA